MDFSEKLLIEDVTQAAQQAKQLSRGLPPGTLIRMIRTQIGMSQEVLSKRAGVPQSTISRIERGSKDANLSTLYKILQALSCELVIVPMLLESVDMIRRRQAKKQAQARVHYLKGTMNLEGQEPDTKFINALIEQEEQRLLQEPNSSLWNDDGSYVS
jgi:transcriptional regulator with XRE-family HTH domain